MKPLTKADRIRQMSDEELATLLCWGAGRQMKKRSAWNGLGSRLAEIWNKAGEMCGIASIPFQK